MLQGEGGLGSMMGEFVRKWVKEHPLVVVVGSAKSLVTFSTCRRSLREAGDLACGACDKSTS